MKGQVRLCLESSTQEEATGTEPRRGGQWLPHETGLGWVGVIPGGDQQSRCFEGRVSN